MSSTNIQLAPTLYASPDPYSEDLLRTSYYKKNLGHFKYGVETPDDYLFLRDLVISIGDRLLVTRPFEEPKGLEKLKLVLTIKALFDQTMSHFAYLSQGNTFVSPKAFIGRGYVPKHSEQAERLCLREQLPYKIGQTILEGGNVFVFLDQDGKKKALIGKTTQVITLAFLEYEGVFNAIQYDPSITVDEDTYKLAYKQFVLTKIIDVKSSFPNFFEVVARTCQAVDGIELSPEFQLQYHEKANILQQKIDRTKLMIAQDLEIEPDNIHYLYNHDYHLDLQMFMLPHEKTVVMNNPHLVIKEIEEIRKLFHNFSADDASRLQECWNNAKQDLPIFHKTYQKNMLAVQKIGLNLQFMALNFCDRDQSLVFANGIACKSHTLSAGPKYYFLSTYGDLVYQKLLAANFSSRLNQHYPNVHYLGVTTATFVGHTTGGTRCLTFATKIESMAPEKILRQSNKKKSKIDLMVKILDTIPEKENL